MTYQYIYASYPPVPGNDPNYPLGWWGWFDQGQYLKSTIAFTKGDFSPSQHFFPPLYAFLGSLFARFSENHPFYIPNLALTLGYYSVLVALFGRYVGWWGAAACGLAGMILMQPLRLQWVIPWTTTPGAFFIISALFLLDRYIRRRPEAYWTPRVAATNAACFGLVIGLQAPLRPADLVLVSPIALIYAVLVLRAVASLGAETRQSGLAAVIGGGVGFSLPVALMVLFNLVTYGSVEGGYFNTISANGFDPLSLPEKLFSHLLASQVFYGEQNADWLSVIPLVFAAVVFLPVALFTGPLVMRAAAAAAVLQFAVYDSYSDLLPTDTFRYFDIHYFKWLAPVALCILFHFLRLSVSGQGSATRQGRAAIAAGLVFGVMVTSIDAVQHIKPAFNVTRDGRKIALDLGGDPVDFVDLLGVSGGWPDVYFAKGSSVLMDGTRPLAMIKDYRFLPIDGGVRLLFFKPLKGGRATVTVGDGMTVPDSFSVADVRPVAVSFRPGLPFAQQSSPAQPAAGYVIGNDISFSGMESGQRYLKTGWSVGEAWGRWIDGAAGTLTLNLGNEPGDDLTITMVVQGFVVTSAHPETDADVYANGQPIGRIEIVTGAVSQVVFRVPATVVAADEDLHLEIRNMTPISPKEMNLSEDGRKLGIGLIRMRIDRADDQPVAAPAKAS